MWSSLYFVLAVVDGMNILDTGKKQERSSFRNVRGMVRRYYKYGYTLETVIEPESERMYTPIKASNPTKSSKGCKTGKTFC